MSDQLKNNQNRIHRTLIVPDPGNDFELQVANCINKLSNNQDQTNEAIVLVSFFIDANNNEEYQSQFKVIHKQIAEHFSNSIPLSIIAQAPANNLPFTIELLSVKPDANIKVSYKSEHGVRYSVIQDNRQKDIIAGGISANQPLLPFFEQVDAAYKALEAILLAEGMSFGNIIRQWNYVEDIIGFHETQGSKYQNYQVLNDVRSSFYLQSDFKYGYPAATGIGMRAGGLILEVYAVSGNENIRILPVKNPNQVDAYAYSDKVLVGKLSENQHVKSTPKFERAKFIGNLQEGMVYISGTASIKNEITIGEGDTQLQTRVALENITKLISSENLENAGLNGLVKTVAYSFVRVYIKNREDVDLIKSICSDFYGSVPVNYLIADVCRDNLLMELEAEAMLK